MFCHIKRLFLYIFLFLHIPGASDLWLLMCCKIDLRVTPLIFFLTLNFPTPVTLAGGTVLCYVLVHNLRGFLCNDYHLLFSAVWWQTWSNHDNLQCLMVVIKVPDVRRWYWPVTIHIYWFSVICMIFQASSSSICFQRLGFVSPEPQSASSCLIHGAVLTSWVICRV